MSSVKEKEDLLLNKKDFLCCPPLCNVGRFYSNNLSLSGKNIYISLLLDITLRKGVASKDYIAAVAAI